LPSDDEGSPVPGEIPVDGAVGGERRGRLPRLVGGLVALLVVVVGVVLLLGGNGENDPDEEGGGAPTTQPAPDTTTEPAPKGPAARITDIDVVDDRYVLEYEPLGFTPLIENAGAFHVHFFWDTLPVINAGTNGPDPGVWLLWDTPFTVDHEYFDVSSRPSGARRICVVVTDNQHGVADVDNDGDVDTDTGNCVDVPDA
jgi:hypothetical protein